MEKSIRTMNSNTLKIEAKRVMQKDSTADGFNLYEKLTHCLGGTQFSVPEYLNIRKDLFMRKPFYLSLKEYLIGRFYFILCCFKFTKEEALIY